jgi:hypothetical protein
MVRSENENGPETASVVASVLEAVNSRNQLRSV